MDFERKDTDHGHSDTLDASPTVTARADFVSCPTVAGTDLGTGAGAM
jgi:hypothetical protein